MGRLEGLNRTSRHNVYYAKKTRELIYDTEDIKTMNRNMFIFINNLKKKVDSGKYSSRLSKMYVVKYDPIKQYKKGHQLLKLDTDFVNRGGTYREIQYLTDKGLREDLNTLSKMMEFNAEGQFGFLSGLDITDNAEHHLCDIEADLVVNFDLEGAFNQITEQEIFSIFRYVFDLNKEDAIFITGLAVIDGFCYQGSPISPILFNILSINLIRNLQRVVEQDSEAVNVSAYADDFTISFKGMKFMPKKKLLYYSKIFINKGWKVNPDKVVSYNINNAGSYAEITGVILWKKETGGIDLRAGNVRALKKKIKLFKRLQDIHKLTVTKNIGKSGDRISISALLGGLQGWLYRSEFIDSYDKPTVWKKNQKYTRVNESKDQVKSNCGHKKMPPKVSTYGKQLCFG